MSVDRGTENRRRRPTNSNSLACQWASPSKVDFLMKIAISDASLVYICVLDGATDAFLISSKSGSSSSTLRHWNLKVHKTFSQQLLQCPGRCQMTRRAAEKAPDLWNLNPKPSKFTFGILILLATRVSHFCLAPQYGPRSKAMDREKERGRERGRRVITTYIIYKLYNIYNVNFCWTPHWVTLALKRSFLSEAVSHPAPKKGRGHFSRGSGAGRRAGGEDQQNHWTMSTTPAISAITCK